MFKEKESTKLLRMVLSIRNNLDEIEHSRTYSLNEVRRLEELDKVFTATLFHKLIDEVIRKTFPFQKDIHQLLENYYF